MNLGDEMEFFDQIELENMVCGKDFKDMMEVLNRLEALLIGKDYLYRQEVIRSIRELVNEKYVDLIIDRK